MFVLSIELSCTLFLHLSWYHCLPDALSLLIILELGCERKNYLSASFLAAAAFLAAASSAAFFASACSRGNCKSQHRCNFRWWQVCERKGELYLCFEGTGSVWSGWFLSLNKPDQVQRVDRQVFPYRRYRFPWQSPQLWPWLPPRSLSHCPQVGWGKRPICKSCQEQRPLFKWLMVHLRSWSPLEAACLTSGGKVAVSLDAFFC